VTEEKQNGVQGPLRLLLRSFKLKGFIDNYQAVAEESERAGRTFESFLYELAKVEAHERRGRRIHRLGKDSKIPREKTLATFDLARIPMVPRPLVAQLGEGGFLDRAENLLVFGNPGTGKTHLVAAVGHELVRNGRSVYFTPAYALVQTLVAAKRALRLTRELARLDRFECLILDDLGYVQQEREEMDVLFTLLAERYERRSVVITSNLVFSKWNQIFKDATTTAAAIDRLVHHSRILELDVESFRAQEADGRRRTIDGKRGTTEKSQDDENDGRKGGAT
jgi:DNA replication protein DnaC